MLLRWLISTIGLTALKGEVSAIARRAAQRAALFFLLMVVWLAAAGFAVAALTVWLASALGPLAACCIVAGVLILVGLALFLGLVLSGRRRTSSIGVGLGGGAPGPSAGEVTGLASIAAIAVVGYLVTRQIFRR